METPTLDAKTLSRMFFCGAKRLESRKEYINQLNVFPVPDGDTGTNMSLTISSAAEELAKTEAPDMAVFCKAVSSGSLRGARGNSGVILSQLFRGFTKSIREYETVGTKEMAAAFVKAKDTAYKAVMKPKEGTILTVARKAAEKAQQQAEKSPELEPFFRAIITQAAETLKKTPDLLPVLKEAGVVDSGGQGLLEFFKGAYDGYTGKETPEDFWQKAAAPKEETPSRYAYRTGFSICLSRALSEQEKRQIREYLVSVGDHCHISGENTVRIRVQTNDPGMVIQKAISYGPITDITVENTALSEEKSEKQGKEAVAIDIAFGPEAVCEEPFPGEDVAFVAVSAGDGLEEIFHELGAKAVVTGGQTMNPSTNDLLEAIQRQQAANIFLLPNNKNILLAANQARELAGDKHVRVIPSKTIPQGIAALIAYEPEASPEENEAAMKDAIEEVRTGLITYAVRDTSINGMKIREGDFMGLDDTSIQATGSCPEEVAMELLRKMAGEETELISLYYGNGTTEETANALAGEIEKAWPDADVACYFGGQPVYAYLLSVE